MDPTTPIGSPPGIALTPANLNPYQSNWNSNQYLPATKIWDAPDHTNVEYVGRFDEQHDKSSHSMAQLSSPQGVYLKGYGVIYTATVPLPEVQATDSKDRVQPLTEWDRQALELRGEKVEANRALAPKEG